MHRPIFDARAPPKANYLVHGSRNRVGPSSNLVPPMAALGHSRPIYSAPGSNNVRCCSNSGQAIAAQGMTRCATSRHVGWLWKFSPCSLGGPPNDFTSSENKNAQCEPPIKIGSDDTRNKHEYWNGHREVIRAGIATVSAPALSCIQNARRAHPDESSNPDGRTNKWWSGQGGKNDGLRKPPCEQIGARVA